MKIKDVIDRIQKAYGPLPEMPGFSTQDTYKCGDPDKKCTGVVSACAASIDVIRQSIALNANLIISHEPLFYSNPDQTEWLEGRSEVYEAKKKLLNDHGIVVWRDHDHMHFLDTDLIFQGLANALGWNEYIIGDTAHAVNFKLPPKTVRELAAELKEKIGLNQVRVIGDLDAVVSTVFIPMHMGATGDERECEHTIPFLEGVDVLIPGETIDWTAISYARDAGQLHRNKAVIALGHFNMEELGMRDHAEWISRQIDHHVPVTYVKAADMYQYV